jgi:Tol biopolymer transport system component/subtilisin-like proprotein convertase family protein
MRRISIFVSAVMVASVVALVPLATGAGAALPTFTTTLDSGIVNVDIGGASSSTMTVPETGRVVDVNVGVRVEHQAVAFVDISLTSPDGTVLNLSSDNGGSVGPGGAGADYGNAADCTSTTGLAVFDDDAVLEVAANLAPFVGPYKPEAPLSVLENETLNGDWTLGVTESTSFSFGEIVCWTMAITYAGPLADADACNQLAWSGFDGADFLIWAANADGQGRAELISPGSGTDPKGNSSPGWSADGTRIAWAGSDGVNNQLWVADPDGTTRVEISSVGSGDDPTGNSDPAWSPDGSRIAWSGADGTTRQIWTADPDGENRTEISNVGEGTDPTANSNPVWSPDGTRIAWWGNDNDNAGAGTQIWVADADGANRVEISSAGAGTDPTANSNPAWSPDGTRIAWSGVGTPTRHIYIAASDGTDRAEISNTGSTADPTVNLNPVWSPDGTRIAWSGLDGLNGHLIWIADPDGTNLVDIVNAAGGGGGDPENNNAPAWSPDGSRISWSGIHDGQRQVWAADPSGTNREAISPVELGPDPTLNVTPEWRSRAGEVALSSSVTGSLVNGDAVTATVTASTTCTTASVVVDGIDLTCVDVTSRTASAGTVSDAGVWTIGTLDGIATATIEGTITSSGACESTASVTAAVPALAGPSTVTFGGPFTHGPCPTDATPFTDVSATSFAVDDIACIYGLGITTGTSPTTYSPDGLVTREQMAAFLARLWRELGQTCPTDATPFTDVSATSFAIDDIACIYGLGITTGTSPTTYSPDGLVTREQMAAFLARLWRSC